MATPQVLADIVRLLLQLLPVMALVCLVLAGVSLRFEGGVAFVIGGNFTKWILWSIIMLTLPGLLLWFSFFGLPVPAAAGGIGTSWLAGILNDVSTFVNTFVVARLTVVLAAYFIIRAVLDATEGRQPLPSVLTAMFLLAIPGTANLISSLQTGTRFAAADALDGLWNLPCRQNFARSGRPGGGRRDFQLCDEPARDAVDRCRAGFFNHVRHLASRPANDVGAIYAF